MDSCGIPADGNYIAFVLRRWRGFEEKSTVFAAAAVYAYLNYGLTPVFLCINHRTDWEAAKLVSQHLSIPYHVIAEPMTSGMTIGVLARMKAVVSMRLHGLVFAAGQGVPLAGVSYDPKVRAFLDYIEQDNYIDLADADAAEMELRRAKSIVEVAGAVTANHATALSAARMMGEVGMAGAQTSMARMLGAGGDA
jgi:polysaccharide pyruvyl transferase WcaK-like protein